MLESLIRTLMARAAFRHRLARAACLPGRPISAPAPA